MLEILSFVIKVLICGSICIRYVIFCLIVILNFWDNFFINMLGGYLRVYFFREYGLWIDF